MKISTLLISILALSLTACGSRDVKETRETIIEKPVAAQESKEVVIQNPTVTREIVVERQVPQSRSCTYGNTTYSSGSLSCQSGYQYQCLDGTWTGRSLSC